MESQITTNGEPLGASFDTPLMEVCCGGDSPLGNRDPVSICIKIQAHHHRIHGGLSQSVTNFLSNLIPVATIRGRSREGIITAFLVPIDDFFMKQPHDMLIEGNQFYPEKSSGIIRLNQLSVDGFFFGQAMAKKNKMENKLDFFGFSSIFVP